MSAFIDYLEEMLAPQLRSVLSSAVSKLGSLNNLPQGNQVEAELLAFLSEADRWMNSTNPVLAAVQSDAEAVNNLVRRNLIQTTTRSVFTDEIRFSSRPAEFAAQYAAVNGLISKLSRFPVRNNYTRALIASWPSTRRVYDTAMVIQDMTPRIQTAVAVWGSRRSRLLEAAALEQARITESLTEVVDTLSDDVGSLASTTQTIADAVSLSPEERAAVNATLADIRSNRAAAKATILDMLSRSRSLVATLEQGNLDLTSGGGAGGALILAAAGAIAWLAFKG